MSKRSVVLGVEVAFVSDLAQRRAIGLRGRRDLRHVSPVRPENDPFDPIGGDAHCSVIVRFHRGCQHAGPTDHPTVRGTGRRLGRATILPSS